MGLDYCIDVSTGHTAVSYKYDEGEIAFINLVLNDGFKDLCEEISNEGYANAGQKLTPEFDVTYHRIPAGNGLGQIALGSYDICFSFFIRGVLKRPGDIEKPWTDKWFYNVNKNNFKDIFMNHLSYLERPTTGKGMVHICIEMLLRKVRAIYGFQ